MEAGDGLAEQPQRAHRRHSEGGFTVARLLLVVIIVGTVLAIAIPTLLVRGEREDDGAARDRATEVLKFLASQHSSAGVYPDTVTVDGLTEVTVTELEGVQLLPGSVYLRITDRSNEAELVAPSDSGECFWIRATPVRNWYAQRACSVGTATPGRDYRLAW
ncbi:MAG: type II secretion system protein [Acidimicrobiales bacterium]